MRRVSLFVLVGVLAVVALAATLRARSPHPHIQQTTTCLQMGMKAGWALDEYYKSHKRYPATLTELVPSELSSLPYCPANREPLRYESTKTTYVLYCPGAVDACRNGAMESYPVHQPVNGVNKVENVSGEPPRL